jgi:putative glutamine amidotransferase
VTAEKGGMLDDIAHGVPPEAFVVNSLHGQGIDRLAAPLRVEARSKDGVIEAASLKQPKGFLLGVQWHPEWRWRESALSRALFRAFGDAAKNYAR